MRNLAVRLLPSYNLQWHHQHRYYYPYTSHVDNSLRNTPDNEQHICLILEWQTMRTLGRNMAWMLQNLKKGAIPAPEPEPWTPTNFIR